MSVTKKFSILIFDYDKVADINKIIVKYSDSTVRSSSHTLFNMEPINIFEIVQDLTFFRMSSENETAINNKFKEMTDELNKIGTDYSIKNEETGKIFTTIKFVDALDIIFDNLEVIPQGTYNVIDELKNANTEFGHCKGYKPQFRIIEAKPIENMEIQKETIYLFTHSPENQLKLKDYITERIMAIDTNFKVELRSLA